MKWLSFLKSKTVWGGILMGLPQILSGLPDTLEYLQTGVFGPNASRIAEGLGIILGAVGVKHAIVRKEK